MSREVEMPLCERVDSQPGGTNQEEKQRNHRGFAKIVHSKAPLPEHRSVGPGANNDEGDPKDTGSGNEVRVHSFGRCKEMDNPGGHRPNQGDTINVGATFSMAVIRHFQESVCAAMDNSFSTVLKFRPVVTTPRCFSAFAASLERPIPSGA